MPPDDTAYTRSALVSEIKAKLKEYDDLVVRSKTIVSVPRPKKGAFRSYFNWIYNDPPVVQEEFEFIYFKEDFMSLGQEADGWLEPMIDSLFHTIPSSMIKYVFSSKTDQAKSSDPSTLYYSNSRWQAFVKILVNAATIMLLILPIVLLYVLNTTRGQKLAILIVFVVLFNTSLSTLTEARRSEIFAASAA